MNDKTPRAARRLPLAVLLLIAGAAVVLLAAPALGSRDLTVTVDGPTTSTDNATISYNLTAHNSGSGAGSSSVVALFVNGNATGVPHDFGNLANGENGSAFENLTLLCGIYTINATVDPADAVPENNETNNNATLSLVVTPFANFTAVQSGAVGNTTLALDASTSHGCLALNYTWSVGGVTFYGSTVSYTPPAGNLTVQLSVRAGANTLLTGHATRVVVIPNAAPSLSLAIADDSIPSGWPLGLSVTADDIDGTVASTFIDFGDGNNSTSPITAATYEYHRGGNFTVTVRVTDNLGATNESTIVVHVANRAPTVVTSFPYWEADAGKAIEFNASGSSDPDGQPLNITWEFGDGTTASGPIVNHTYDAPGTYMAKVKVTDASGDTREQTMQIRIDPKPSGGGSTWWLWILVLVVLALLALMILRRRRQTEEAPTPPRSDNPSTPADKPAAPADQPSGEGSSSKPPSP